MNKMHDIGIMQGRLTPMKGRGIQFFPFDNWEKEFYEAQKIGINEIEFIFDYEDYEKNPLYSKEGILRIQEIVKETKVAINTVCFDYFMKRPFMKAEGEARGKILDENRVVLKNVLHAMEKIGATLIEIPLVDNSSVKTEEEKCAFQKFLEDIIEDIDIRIGLETDFSPQVFKRYLDTFANKRIGANYDSGNSSGLGYDAYEEVTILKDYIFNIHIKDRVYHGTTVSLGSGSANFERLFQGLREIQYSGSFILQAARGEEGKESCNIQQQMEFIRGLEKNEW